MKKITLMLLMVICVAFGFGDVAFAHAVDLSQPEATIYVGERFKLKATGGTVKWTSDNKKVATVKKGVVTAKKKGTVTVKASVAGKKLKCKIRVKKLPKYTGEPVVKVADKAYFSANDKNIKKGFERYAELDSLGRCGVAYINACKDTIPTESRGDIGSVKPTGWHTVKYPGTISDLYLYNRCHLAAFCLSGENANKRNLITGTRYLNVQGMLPYELKVARYLDAHPDNHVLYRVRPVFIKKNLVSSGVVMEAYSIEDSEIEFNIYAFNVQPGITIDYKDGTSKLSGSSSTTEAKTNNAEEYYVLNTNTKKIHKSTCSSVSTIAPHNYQEYTGDINDLLSQGYSKCKACNP